METGSAHGEQVVVFLLERNLAITSRKEEMKENQKGLKRWRHSDLARSKHG